MRSSSSSARFGSGLSLFSSLFIFGASLFLLWVLAASKWVDRRLFRLIGWALRTFTRLDVRDYHGLLHLSEGFTVLEVPVKADHWATGSNLMQLRLADEGIQVLGIQRVNGAYVGTPTGETYVRSGDTLLLYGREDLLQALDQRRKDEAGNLAHVEACATTSPRDHQSQAVDIRPLVDDAAIGPHLLGKGDPVLGAVV